VAPGLDEDADADATGLAESRPYLPKAPGLDEDADADATGVEWDECVGYTGMVTAKGNSLTLGGLTTRLLQHGHVVF
jgi:hypothetical protein